MYGDTAFWGRVTDGAMFVHSRFVNERRQHQVCRIYKVTDHDVFYVIGSPDGERVYTPRDQFPAAVTEWVDP